jgi:hypothetical protein
MVQFGLACTATATSAVPASLKPLQLGAMLHQYLVVHRPSQFTPDGAGGRVPWPCDKVRQAARLRDGF